MGKRCLIFGAAGYVGNYLYSRFRADKYDVVGFSRGTEEYGVRFDLLTFDPHKSPLRIQADDLAIIAIAQSNIDRCWLEYEDAYKVNVIKTKELVKYLCGQGARVILFSSDSVFGDNRGNYTETDPVSPINKYGEMKAELERFAREEYPGVCVFRLPKVYGLGREDKNFLHSLYTAVQNAEPIRCIKGSRMSLISQEDIYQACVLADRLNLMGLYNLAEDDCYSRKDLAQIFVSALEVEKTIVEIPVTEFNFADKRPCVINMNNGKFINDANYRFHDYKANVGKYTEGMKADNG